MKLRWLLALSCVSAVWGQPTVATEADFKSHDGQRVVLVGSYERVPEKPSTGPTGVEGFQPGPRPYGRARILVGDTEVSVNPPLEKTCLRPPDELEDFHGQRVRATGVVHAGKAPYVQLESLSLDLPESKEYEPRSLVDRLKGLTSWKFVRQSEASGAPWDLVRDYAATIDGQNYEVRLYRYPAGPPAPPPEMPDGMQVAYSTGGTPAHVGRIGLTYQATPANWNSVLQGIAEHALGATPAQLEWLGSLKASGEKDGLVVEVEPGKTVLYGGDDLRSRRVHAVLEPRTRRK